MVHDYVELYMVHDLQNYTFCKLFQRCKFFLVYLTLTVYFNLFVAQYYLTERNRN